MGIKKIAENRRARREYEILDSFEAGIALQGTEVKSLRAGHLTFKDSFADIQNGELFLLGAHISPYEQGNIYNHAPERPRKLLMHRQQIQRLASQVAEKGLTLTPLSMYFKDGVAKVQLGLCRGKKLHDKRATIQERDSKREIERAVKDARIGR